MKKEDKTRIIALVFILIILAVAIIFVAKMNGPNKNYSNENPEIYYVNEDPEFCQRILFLCVENYEPFFDDTGCGCEKIN